MKDGERARVFLALPCGGELGRRLAELTADALGGVERAQRNFRLPRAEGLHVTLFFLGDVPTDRLAGLWSDVQAELSGARAPVLCIAQAGAFPERGRERVLWLGVQEESEGRLEFLHQGTLAAVRRAGFDPRRTGQGEHRPYHAHVTVGRPRGRRTRVPAAFYDLAPRLPWTPTEVALLESVRAASGPPVYESRERLALGVG